MIKLPPFNKNLGRDIKILDIEGHKPTHASVLLLWYSLPTSDIKSACELGSGTGFVSFGLAKLYGLKVVGIEKEKSFYENAVKSKELNESLDVEFLNMDVENVRENLAPESFDMVVFNPPYHFYSDSTNHFRKISRKGSHFLLEKFIKAAFFLLKNRGTFVCVISPYILPSFMTLLTENKLMPQQMCVAYGKKAELVLIRGKKNGGEHLEIDNPLYLK
ncbi:MAG: tRNA1Val (adenine37-N6)-methyltransferase [Thermosipho sp. (in: thermotogales)]|nr:tRNA1Val (adenine37-N6)-methyltransferase [Thermosipho sp. (in: thermotogales)]